MTDLTVDSTAREHGAARSAAEQISARELLDLHLARIAERNPELNAIVSLDEERARAGRGRGRRGHGTQASRSARCTGCRSRSRTPTTSPGWRTTYGSPLYADHVPDADDLLVERIRGAGAVTIGKTNVPEFAAGSHTFNTVFGTTLNPVDPTRSAGGSSGGAACALAAGMVPLADGSDMGGSLRNPASFCGVVGPAPVARPGARLADRTPGRPRRSAARWPATSATSRCCCRCSPARTRGRRSRWRPRPPVRRRRWPAPSPGCGSRCRVDLGGAFEVDDEVAAVVVARPRRRSPPPARSVAAAHPDLSLGRRHLPHAAGLALPGRSSATLLAEHPDAFKESLADNIRAGEALTGADVARAYEQRTACAERMRAVLRRRTTCWCCRSPRCRRSRPTRSSRRDQRAAAGDLPRLDALGVPHHRHRLPGDLGPGRHHPGRPAGRHPDRRPVRRRPRPARGRGGLRGRCAADGPWRASLSTGCGTNLWTGGTFV